MKTGADTSAPCTVYLMRHGDTRTDGARRYVGWTDLPLTDKGRLQAAWWQRELSGVVFDRIISSDLQRSVETAEIIAKGRNNVAIELRPDLREIHLGRWDGMRMEEVRLQYPSQYEERGIDPAAFRPEGGESFLDLSDRVIPAFGKLAETGGSGNILIVAHGGVNRVILCGLLGMPLPNLFRLAQDFGCLNMLACGREWTQIRAVNLVPDTHL